MYAASSVSLLTAPFNITDLLQTPVPYSIYTSQPWCASELFWGQLDTTDTTTFSCATTAPCKPIIVAPGELLANIDPAFASCSPEVKGFYDPPRALKKTDVAATPTTPTPAGPPHTTPAQTAQGLVTQVPETTARSRSREEQTAAQHTNRPTAQEDSSPSRTQDVGGLVASLMGGDKHDPVPAQDDGSEDPVTNDPAGVVASLLAADSTGFSRPKDHARPAVVQTAQSPDSADLTNPSPAWPEAAESTADISLSGSANTVTTDTLVSNLPPGADTLAQGTKPRLDAPAPTTTNAAVGASEPTFLSTFPGSRSDYPSPAAPEAIMTFGSSSMTITSGQPFVILDQTLSVGGEAVTVHGQHVSAATEGVVVDGVTTAFSKVSAAGEVNATASASESIAVYTGGVSDKHTRRDWVMLWICSGFVHFLLALI